MTFFSTSGGTSSRAMAAKAVRAIRMNMNHILRKVRDNALPRMVSVLKLPLPPVLFWLIASGLHPRLRRVDLVVDAALGHQLFVAALFGELAFVQHEDVVRVGKRRETVREYDDRRPRHVLSNAFDH